MAAPQHELARDVAPRLKLIRKTFGKLTQHEFCAVLEIKPSRLAQYEAALNLIPVHLALILVAKYGLTLDWIYRGDVSGLSARTLDKLSKAEKDQ